MVDIAPSVDQMIEGEVAEALSGNAEATFQAAIHNQKKMAMKERVPTGR
jgi:hypothetical protein